MKKGDIVHVIKGAYKGAYGSLYKITKAQAIVKLMKTYIARNDEDGDDTYYTGDTLYVHPSEVSMEGERTLVEQQIREKIFELRGLLVKKKYFDDPTGYESDVKKILECVDV